MMRRRTMISKKEALDYHSIGRKGKIEVKATKPCRTQRDLSLAYTPGVAQPCLEIKDNPNDAYRYTAKGNLVAVVSNGTAVLGLGNIGALAGKPVMEGKGVLFKRFADVDVFDIEVDTLDADELIRTVKLLEPTFGGINLEDIKAPECFYIEETLIEMCDIPIFHDDQHGTAIISGAGLLNALELVGKKIEDVKVVFCGAGAAGIACAQFYVSLGVRMENVIMVDSKGVIYKGRTERMNPYKERFAVDTPLRTLDEAMEGADVFCGVSVKDMVTKEMVASMAPNPIIFAMANPDPEITYPDAKSVRDDLIMATGRSDYPNQVNNVLGFPFIFRGALDVRARKINEEMKIAAAHALANLAKQDVPDSVCKAYGVKQIKFGPEYIIPKPFDPRVLLWEASAVAKAAMESGVARMPIEDFGKYREALERRLGRQLEVMRPILNQAMKDPMRIVFPEGGDEKIVRASHILVDEGIAKPILLGAEEKIEKVANELEVSLEGIEVVDPWKSEMRKTYIEEFYRLRQRKGVTLIQARDTMRNRNYYGSMMVHMGDADGLVSGRTQNYPDTMRPALQIIKLKEGITKVSGVYIMIFGDRVLFFADTTVNILPTASDLAEIAICTAETAKMYVPEVRIAMLSFSNFGMTQHPIVQKVKDAVEIIHRQRPDLIVDGDMQADTAVVREIQEENFPFCLLKGEANVLIFPCLNSANVAYKLLHRLGGAFAIGPILQGINMPTNVLQRGSTVEDVVNMAAITVVSAQEVKGKVAAKEVLLPV
jgi:malate dehydrogenase (oxaloacetate-decarboxylating)(NADP+)